MCIDIVESWFGIAKGQNSSIFDRVICPWQMVGYYRFRFYYTPTVFSGGHKVSHLSIGSSCPYVQKIVPVLYLLERLVYWIRILYTGI